ncbi:hypothetical protein [Haloflavibacter putidus]|uniref:DUF4258 domain-containing protein n=1 Tax=Haloflavibacter putidus TaxID=2576776 RepID=A0A507ZRC6_9FLAO|nr:hypothetical protein [Haloflavibacter putidus]TQD39073.1 hypothetical protein FKR84_06665 [Haloflavibacter putidus]
MKFIYRLAYYLGGFFLGIIILFFFLGGKKTSCAYGPNARVLKNIRTKPIEYSSNAALFFKKNQLDSTDVEIIFTDGDVDFSNSETNGIDTCNIFRIEHQLKNKKEIRIRVLNCDSLATIQKADFIKK